MRALRIGAFLLSCFVASLLGGSASADDGAAALLPFQGAQAAKVRQTVQKGLRSKGVRLVPLKKVNGVVSKTKGYAKQAARLQASVLVKTRVRRVESRFVADTEIRNAKGERVKKLKASSSSVSRLSSRIVAGLMGTGLMPSAEKVDEPPTMPTEPRIVIRPFKGTQASKVRGAAIRGLSREPVELFQNAKLVAEAKKLGTNLSEEGGHVEPAAALGVSALFEGDVLREDGVWSAYVRLVDGRSATVVEQHYYDASSLSGLMKRVQSRVGPDFLREVKKIGVLAPASIAVVPAAPVPVMEKAPAPAPQQPKAETKSDKGPAAVDIEVDFRLIRRTLTWNDDLRGDLRDYTLNAGPGVAILFQYYPGAHFTDGVGAQFGLDFSWDRLFDFESKRADGTSFPTESQQFLIGLRWRYPTGRWEPFVVVDYGVHNFRFGVSGPPVPGQDNTAGVPSVRYEFVRIGGGFRVALGKKETFTIGANIALRGVFDVGGIGTNAWFPEAKANGMDAGLVFGFVLPHGFEVRIGGDYRRYWFDLNPQAPNPPYVAGGALDQYLGLSIGLAWRW